MPTSVDIKNLKINKLTEAQYDAAVQGGVIGENELSVLTDAELEQIQVNALPTASADELGKIYQYIGATDANYTNGYFYKCEGAGDPAVYSWAQVNVQPAPSGLPDQTGQSGKFLTTDGTDASWATLNALQNTATGNNSLTILGTANTSERNSVNIGYNSSIVQNNGYAYALAVGASARAASACCAVGTSARTDNNAQRCTLIGNNTETYSSPKYGVAIGQGTAVGANGAIQLGTDATLDSQGRTTNNLDANTLKVANANGNFEMMDANGYIPAGRLKNAATAPSTMPTLAVADWSSNTQTVTVTGVTASNIVFVSPAPASASDYASAGIICTAQGTDSLTFTCTTVPTNAITVNVVIMG